MHLQVLNWQGLVGLVMEYAAGGALSALISARCGLPETAARWFFQQIVIAVDFCHRTVCWYIPISEDKCHLKIILLLSLRVCADTMTVQGFACQDVKLENVLIVNDARALVKLRISQCSQVRACPLHSCQAYES